jgi:hypothetical protein
MNNRAFLLPLTFGTALALSACGGGGGGNSGTVAETNPPTTTLSVISEGNSAKAASNAHAASTSLSGSSATVTAALTGVSIEGLNISTVAPTLELMKRTLGQGAPKLLTGVSFTNTTTCTGGGSVSVNANVRDETAYSNGDTITFTTANCVEGGLAMNGAFTITLAGVSGNPFVDNAWGATLDVRYSAFRVTVGSTAVSADGDMKIGVKQTSLSSNTVSISGKSLATSATTAGVAVASRTLTDYSVSGETQGNTFTGAANYTLSGNSSALGAFTYSVKNIQPFVSTGINSPTSGSLIVNGAASSVTMTVIDAGANVRLEYSAKGDGVITQTSTVSWATFVSSI